MSLQNSETRRPIRAPAKPATGMRSLFRRLPAGVRRLLTFLLLISVLIGSLSFLGDGPTTLRSSSRGSVPDTPGIIAGKGETTVVIGRMNFDIADVFEVAPGRFERRVQYVVRFEEGRPSDDGFFLLSQPHITVMNPMTADEDDELGEISAQAGRFRTDQPSVGSINLTPSGVALESFSLSGDVSGRYVMADGTEIALRAEELDLSDNLLVARGAVVWTRESLSLSGDGMVWNQTTQHLEFGANAKITLAAGARGPGAILRGAGGLVWDQPAGSDVLGHGALRGPVTGELSDGSSLAADHLALDGDARSLTLTGNAQLEQLLTDGVRRVRADHITVAQGDDETLSLIHTEGNVRFEQERAGQESTWLEASSLTQSGHQVFAPGLVRWGRGSLVFSGFDLTLNENTRRLSYAADLLMDVPLDAPSTLAGMSFRSPGGMEWILPEGAVDPWTEALGRFSGVVTGQTAYGLRFRCNALEQDGPAGLLLLLGDVHAELKQLGLLQVLDAQRVELALDQGKQPVDLTAKGSVRVGYFPMNGSSSDPPPSWTLSGEQLQVLGERVRMPGEVLVERDDFTLTGIDLEFDGASGHLELTQQVVMRLADGSIVRSPAGLVWDQPMDPSLGFQHGVGELRGPATGESPSGVTFGSDTIELDGSRLRIGLVGNARVMLPGDRLITAQKLYLVTSPAGQRIKTSDSVHWQGPLSKGDATGLQYDVATRQLIFEQDVSVSFLALDGSTQLQLEGDGPLLWTGPEDESLPLWFGSGELRGNVTALSPEGRLFSTDELLLDGSTGRFDLIGPSQVALPRISGLGNLSARERITVLQDLAGEVVWLDAYGDVAGSVESSGETVEYGAESLLFDRETQALVLDGESRIERVRTGKTVGLAGDARTRLVSVFDELGKLTSLAGEGRITSNMGSFTILSDSLNWDVSEDYMVLTGNCRVLRFGGEVATPMVEIWPLAWRWHVHPMTGDVDGG